jgi:Na+/melibiose symporter-like transporter
MTNPTAFRPTARLGTWPMLALAGYWLGIATMWAGVSAVLAGRLQFEALVPPGTEGASLFQMLALGGIVAIGLQPAVGMLSDQTASRWGRRRPYIVAGALGDVVFLIGIASSSTVLAIAGFVFALQISSNIAQGPYQGLVPDLVPERQVGVASGLVGLMVALGNVAGYLVGAVAIAWHSYAAATIGLGVFEVATMVVLVVSVNEPSAALEQRSRSWLDTARRAFSSDVLQHRSFLWLVASRLAFLTGGSVITTFAPFYVARCFGLSESETGTLIAAVVGMVAVGTIASVVPAARLSDRIGRKRVIFAACAASATGIGVLAVAPSVTVAAAGAVVFGMGTGAFLGVDWALLSELVPLESAGRFMGIANVAAGSAGIAAAALGGTVMDLVGGMAGVASGPRAAMAAGALGVAAAALLLRPVQEPDHG